MSARGRIQGLLLFSLAGGIVMLTPSPARSQDKRFEASGFVGSMSVSHDLGSVSNLFFTTTGPPTMSLLEIFGEGVSAMTSAPTSARK